MMVLLKIFLLMILQRNNKDDYANSGEIIDIDKKKFLNFIMVL